MPAITMIIWLGTTPAQVQAVQAGQATPAIKYDMIRVEQQRAVTAERTSEPRAKARAELPSSMR
ncbi:MAG: hypothetical protein HS104_11740 [Polyangiaceae bacterium]|nr:hypothetical protein [Polyangiaceae bacterium]MCL4748549.1 hypothetical protein [Myxococcales bacterium]